jgi:stage II sporulation protein P
VPVHLSNHRRKGQRNHANNGRHFYYSRLFLWFLTGMCLCMFIVSVVQQYMPQSNHVLKRWTAEQPTELLVTAIGMEIPLLQTFQRDADGQSAEFPVFTMQSLSTSLIDPQLFFRQELPGFTLYEGQVVIPGQDGNYADIPMESSPPKASPARRPVPSNAQWPGSVTQ